MITTVHVADAAVDPGLVLAGVVITHGRHDILDGPTASSAAIILELPPTGGMPTWGSGATLELFHDNGQPAFSGRVAERNLTHYPEPGQPGRLALTASGTVARLGYRPVGDEPWPAESGAARAERILTVAGVPHLIDGAADAMVLPLDVHSRTALDVLTDLVVSTAAAVVDLPDGRVVYQPMAERARPVKPFRWMDFDPAFTWADFAPDFTWADFAAWHSADSEFALALPSHAVEHEPAWSASEDDVINHVRIGYGTPAAGAEQEHVEVEDQVSINLHGRRYHYQGTQLSQATDATAYASWWLAVKARDYWSLTDITVHLDQLDTATRGAVLALTCGDHITVADMPTPAPAIVYEGIVEGWTYTQWADRGALFNELVVHTTAPLESLAVMTWADFPPDYTWADFPAHLTWADLTDTSVLTGA